MCLFTLCRLRFVELALINWSTATKIKMPELSSHIEVEDDCINHVPLIFYIF